MANMENKTTSQSNLRDASATSDTTGKVSERMSEKMDSLRDTAERFASDASPRMREALHQISDTASDLYQRANNWLSQGNNKNYGFIGMIAAAGILGFFLGRSLGTSTYEEY